MRIVQPVFGKSSFSCRAEGAFSIPISSASAAPTARTTSSKEVLCEGLASACPKACFWAPNLSVPSVHSLWLII